MQAILIDLVLVALAITVATPYEHYARAPGRKSDRL